MANLKSAAEEIKNAKKVNQSSWEDSTYRQRIETTLKEIAPGLEGDRLDLATKFFKPEWEIRSQKFLKRFMMWSTKTKDADKVDFISFAKFGNNQTLNVAAIANNLDIGFPAAILQVVQLVALNLARRVEPTVTPKGDPTFNVIFLPSSYMRFFLGTMDVAEDEFTDEDIHELATTVFAHEVEKKNWSEEAVRMISAAVQVKHDFEENAKRPTEAVREMCQKVLKMFQARPNEAHPLNIIASNLKVDPRMVNFCALVLALHDKEFVRVVTPKSPGNIYSFSLGAPADIKHVEIGSLSTQHAKEVLKAAAAQSPTASDPVIPSGTISLDAAMLGAATIEQLQKTEQVLRGLIDQVGSSLSTRIMNLASDVDEKDNKDGWTSPAQAGLQAQIDTLRDQVAVLMKLGGLPPTAPKIASAETIYAWRAAMPKQQKKPERLRVAKKKTKKKATKKPAKKTKKRR